ncbi:MAG TPA: sugar kinase [Chitinophagaceae bacterium]|nr:sugar kinase [Chitinophagaceae bacterium]
MTENASTNNPSNGPYIGSWVFCFGELLLRMSPELNRQWIHDASIPVYIGGAELNVATALSKWNIPARYCTALPDNYLSKEIIQELAAKKIDTSAIHLSGHRVGIYYLPQGTDLKNAGVIYDRAHSSFAELKPGMINWDKALKDCSWFHFSAISPALNENSVAVCREALEAASAKGLTISVDLNYRAKLWQYGKQPVDVMPELLEYCDVVMGNIWAAESLLGIPSSIKDSKGKTRDELIQAAAKSMKAIHLAYPKLQSIAYTFRLDETYFAVLQHGPDMPISKEFPLLHIADKVGSGDCFMGGLIYGLYNKNTPQAVIDFAAAAAVGKMKETGDATDQSIETVLKTVNEEWKATKL